VPLYQAMYSTTARLAPAWVGQRAGTGRQVRGHIRSLENHGYEVTIEPLDPHTSQAITR
jgi:hypothetical protein